MSAYAEASQGVGGSNSHGCTANGCIRPGTILGGRVEEDKDGVKHAPWLCACHFGQPFNTWNSITDMIRSREGVWRMIDEYAKAGVGQPVPDKAAGYLKGLGRDDLAKIASNTKTKLTLAAKLGQVLANEVRAPQKPTTKPGDYMETADEYDA